MPEKSVPLKQKEELSEILTIEPAMFKVLMHNDDFTTMDFVIEMLIRIFSLEPYIAEKKMLEIHRSGIAICGIFTYDIARTKIEQVHREARAREFPLLCTMEEA